jgi:hypothetical protein
MDYRPPAYRAPQDMSLDGIFNAYMQNKATSRQQQIQDQQIADSKGAQIRDQGFLNTDLTPERFARANQPAPSGIPYREGMAPQEDPTDSAIRSFLDRKKQSLAMGAQKEKLGLADTQAGIELQGAQSELARANADKARREALIPPEQKNRPNSTEFTARGFADKARQANESLSRVQSGGFDAAGVGNIFQSIAPTAMQSDGFQQADQARRQFVNAILRRESGAAIPPSELENYTRQYFPVPGDSEAVKAQKVEARKLAIAGLEQEGSRVPSSLGASPAPAGGGSMQQQAAQILAQRRANAGRPGR